MRPDSYQKSGHPDANAEGVAAVLNKGPAPSPEEIIAHLATALRHAHDDLRWAANTVEDPPYDDPLNRESMALRLDANADDARVVLEELDEYLGR